MDLTTLIGLLLSGILMVYGIGMDKLGNFVDVPSVVIVVGGTLAALIASYGKEVRSIERRMAELDAGGAAGRDGHHRGRPAAPER